MNTNTKIENIKKENNIININSDQNDSTSSTQPTGNNKRRNCIYTNVKEESPKTAQPTEHKRRNCIYTNAEDDISI